MDRGRTVWLCVCTWVHTRTYACYEHHGQVPPGHLTNSADVHCNGADKAAEAARKTRPKRLGEADSPAPGENFRKLSKSWWFDVFWILDGSWNLGRMKLLFSGGIRYTMLVYWKRRTHLEAWRVGEGFRPSVCLSENLKIRGFRSSWYLHSPRVVDHGAPGL